LKKSFFTIIELFIAIALIAILFSLLSPVLQKNLSFARSHQCAQQQKSIYVSLNFYQDDHYFIPTASQVITGDPNHFWFEAIEPYHGAAESKINSNIQWCPDVEDFKENPSVLSYAINAFNQLAIHKNLSPSKKSNTWWTNHWVRLDSNSDVSSPFNTLLLTDHGRNNNAAWTHPALRSGTYFDGLSINLPDFRHLGGKNVLFLDGHVSQHFKGEFDQALYLK
jgi:prepilin-type processing-associated H-X9-DG protein